MDLCVPLWGIPNLGESSINETAISNIWMDSRKRDTTETSSGTPQEHDCWWSKQDDAKSVGPKKNVPDVFIPPIVLLMIRVSEYCVVLLLKIHLGGER